MSGSRSGHAGGDTLPAFRPLFAVPSAAEHEQVLTDDTEDLDAYPDHGLPRHTRLMLLRGAIPTTAAAVAFVEQARPT